MFKSSFAQEMLQETRQHKQLQDEILPKELGGGVYKSQFAASTHGPLDNVNISLEDDQEVRRTGSKYGNIDNINESGDQAINMNHELHTSDLGTSDFSSSELWPPSTSSSPFEYTPRYRGVVSGSGSSLHADNRDNRVNSQGSFLNLQSSMQFSYLKRACMELDLGLDDDDWNSIATNLLKDFNKNIRNVAINNMENFVNLGDFLSELQSQRDEKKRRQPKDDNSNYSQKSSISEEDLTDHLSSKALTAKLAAKELETLQVRLECQQLYNDNVKLREEFKQLKQMANPKKYLELQKEIEHLHWQLNKMENSRKLYELATGQLVTFLEQVSSSLSSSSSGAGGPGRGSQSTLTDVGVLSSESIMHAKRLSLASLDMARSQSMPGLADSLHLLTLPKTRRISASSREKRVRRSSSVSKTRVSSASPLPSLAEAEDGPGARPGCEVTGSSCHISDNQSTESFPLYSRHHQAPSSVSGDPLCVSTPKIYKCSRIKAKTSAGDIHESDIDTVSVSKRGTLTSLSSGSSSSASPPSSSEASGRENCSTGSGTSASLERSRRDRGLNVQQVQQVQHARSMSSLLSEPKVVSGAGLQVTGEQKVVMASRAGRLLRSVKLLLAREKSYDVSTAEGRKRGRRLTKSVSTTRSREQSLDVGPVLSGGLEQPVEDTEERRSQMRRKLEHLELELKAAELVTRTSISDHSSSLSKHEMTSNSSNYNTIQKQQVVRKRSSQKREAPQPKTDGSQRISRKNSREVADSGLNLTEEEEPEENCIMCIKEKTEISERNYNQFQQRPSSRQRTANKRFVGDGRSDSKVQRSKSDAQDKVHNDDLKSDNDVRFKNSNSISSKIIKRSMSFNRIFNYSMLSRSKEYRL